MAVLSEDEIDSSIACEACIIIANYLIKYGRVSVWQYKEKYGTVRVYCSLGFYNIYSIIYPGHAWVRWPLWIRKLDDIIGFKIASVLNKVILPYHCWLYRRAYKKAINKFPFYKERILIGADFPELLNGL